MEGCIAHCFRERIATLFVSVLVTQAVVAGIG